MIFKMYLNVCVSADFCNCTGVVFTKCTSHQSSLSQFFFKLKDREICSDNLCEDCSSATWGYFSSQFFRQTLRNFGLLNTTCQRIFLAFWSTIDFSVFTPKWRSPQTELH